VVALEEQEAQTLALLERLGKVMLVEVMLEAVVLMAHTEARAAVALAQ
tara:strand:+ start:384 stop:527 length:144 start_codon:yes stop_codon:yes gene_type:complete